MIDVEKIKQRFLERMAVESAVAEKLPSPPPSLPPPTEGGEEERVVAPVPLEPERLAVLEVPAATGPGPAPPPEPEPEPVATEPEPKPESTEERLRHSFKAVFDIQNQLLAAIQRGDDAEGSLQMQYKELQASLPLFPEVRDTPLENIFWELRDEFARNNAAIAIALKKRETDRSEAALETSPPTSPLARGEGEGLVDEKALDEARERMAVAEGRLLELGTIDKLLGSVFKESTQKKLEQERKLALREYQGARDAYLKSEKVSEGLKSKEIVERYSQEQDRLLEERWKARLKLQSERQAVPPEAGKLEGKLLATETKLRGFLQEYYDWHRSLSPKKKALISYGLLGAGLAAAAVTPWLSAGVFAGRRLFGATGVGFGVNEIWKNRADAKARKEIEKVLRGKNGGQTISLEQIEEYRQALLHDELIRGGNEASLRGDKLYQDLMAKRGEALERLIEDETQGVAALIGQVSQKADEAFYGRLKEARKKELVRKGAAILAAGTVGAGVLGHLLEKTGIAQELKEYFAGLKEKFAGFGKELEPFEVPQRPPPVPKAIEFTEPPPQIAAEMTAEQKGELDKLLAAESAGIKPPPAVEAEALAERAPSPGLRPPSPPEGGEEVKIGKSLPSEGVGGKIELRHGGKPTGATLEFKADYLSVQAGQRGIEGALLDLKAQEPAMFRAAHQWLEHEFASQAPGADNSDGALVHRFVLDYASEQNIPVEDLDQIKEAQIRVLQDGTIKIENLEGLKPLEPFQPPERRPEIPLITDEPPRLTYEEMSPSPPSSPPQGEGVKALELQSAPEQMIKTDEADLAQAKLEELDSRVKLREVREHPPALERPVEFEGQTFSTFSSALSTVLGEKRGDFLNNILRVTDFDLVSFKDHDLADFMERFEQGSPQFKLRFSGVHQAIEIALRNREFAREALPQKRLGQFVLELAKRYH